MKISENTVIQRQKILFGLATVQKRRDGSTRVKFSTLKISAILVSLFIIGWVGLFSAAYFHFKYRRGYKEASYFETLAFPFTKENFQRKRGQYYIKSAYTALEEGDYRSALNLLRNGLLRAPEDLKARRTLSEFYDLLLNRPQLAFDLLADGLPFVEELSDQEKTNYLQYVFSLGSRNQLDQKLIDAGQTIFSETEGNLPEALKSLVAYQIASGYRNLGNTDASRELIKEYQLQRFSEGFVLTQQINWDNGFEELAISELRKGLNAYQQNRTIYEKLITLLEEKQLIDQADRYSNLYHAAHRNVFASHLAKIKHQYEHKTDHAEQVEFLIKNYLSLFASDTIAIRQLAVLTSKYGDVDNTQIIVDLLKQKDPTPLLADFILIESIIRGEKPEEAIERISLIEEEYNDENPLNPDFKSIIISLKTAAYHAAGDDGNASIALKEFLASPIVKIDRYLAVTYLFLEVNAPEIALQIMEKCVETHASNANVREALISIHLKTENIKELSEVLLDSIDTRRLPNKLLIDSYRLLSSDRHGHLPERDNVMSKIQGCFSTDYLFK